MSIRNASPALAAAILFGAGTPLAKLLVGNLPPLLLAGLLYLGSGLGLGVLLLWRGVRDRAAAENMRLPVNELPWLFGAILFGGVLGPALLMWGLTQTAGATASLLLNVEGVLTAVIAWVVFKENADRQIVLGMVAIVAGGVLLSWEPGTASISMGALLIVGACLCWALDNNLTRKVSSNDAMMVACLKGLLARMCNTVLALSGGTSLPSLHVVVGIFFTPRLRLEGPQLSGKVGLVLAREFRKERRSAVFGGVVACRADRGYGPSWATTARRIRSTEKRAGCSMLRPRMGGLRFCQGHQEQLV
jgi:drug/metabolite transporter (DMT)-like permease